MPTTLGSRSRATGCRSICCTVKNRHGVSKTLPFIRMSLFLQGRVFNPFCSIAGEFHKNRGPARPVPYFFTMPMRPLQDSDHPRCPGPELFQTEELPFFGAEDVDDHVTAVHEHPARRCGAFTPVNG